MTEITLQEYLNLGHTQQDAALILGCTQGAVWQMLNKNRDIRFRLNKRGKPVSFYEIKRPRAVAS
jgi:predicted transcriptional regulator